jgi:hypothetical protein
VILDGLAVVLVFLAGINVTLTAILIRAALRHHWAALEERATVAAILALIAIGAAALGLNRLHLLNFPTEVSLTILAIGLILVSIPSIVWFVAYRTGRFDEPDSSGQGGRP